MPARACIALGSNLGDRARWLEMARTALHADPAIVLIAQSVVEETPPLGGLPQPAYLNQMVLAECALSPRELLTVCQRIEHECGREHVARWASRTLDLDVVRYGDLLCDLPDLSLPHPGLRDRTFWAREIAELESHG